MRAGAVAGRNLMLKHPLEGQIIEGLGVIETVESDNVLRWDG